MFETSLKDALVTVFGIPKVTYEAPSEAKEQQCLFVKIDSATSSIRNGVALAKVMGTISIFANSDKLPFGFFAKRIQRSEPDDTSAFYFYNMDKSEQYFGNLVERTCSFVYFYSEQYDPNGGLITSMESTITFDEE
jgi:hypothetical protein